jgi:hypothetical protein
MAHVDHERRQRNHYDQKSRYSHDNDTASPVTSAP